MKLSKLKNNPNNPRILKDDKFKKLVKSIKEFPKMMELRPMVIDKNNIVLGGNMRLKALKELDYKDIPDNWVKRADELTEVEKERFIIADNVGFGVWDWDELNENWDENNLIDWGLEIPEFEAEILEAKEDDYQEPETMQVDVIKGDLVEFVCDDGRVHRLLCGDSTCSDSVAKLIDNNKINLVFTDPPYGINIGNQSQGKGGGVAKKIDYGINDWDKKIPYIAIGNCLKACENVVLWGANYYADKLPPSSCWLVWDKDNGSTDFADCEIAWTSYKKAIRLIKWKWSGMLQQNMKNKEKRVHPTQKPVALPSWFFNKFNVGKNVLDLFLGSGSTMVAAHQLNSICYGMELDEKYCQVIIDRMTKLDETLTIKINGKEYKKEAQNVPF